MIKSTNIQTKNPFLSGLYSVKTRTRQTVIASGGYVDVVDTKTGEVQTGLSTVSSQKLLDAENFVKLYPAGLLVFGKLSTRGQNVLAYLLSEMKYEDTVHFILSKCREHTGYSDKSHIYKAISELKKMGVIANSSRPKHYFINPLMFYRGDRLKLIR